MEEHDDHSVEEIVETPEVADAIEQDHSQETPDQAEKRAAKEKRHADQIAGKQQQLLEAEVKLAKLDATNLLELAKKDPKLADEVAKKFNYASFKDAEKVIIWGTKVEEKTDDDFDTRYQKKRAEEKHQEALELAKEILSKLPEDKQDEAYAKFDEIAEGKMLTAQKAIEFAEMTTLFVSKSKLKEEAYNDWLAKLASTGVWASKKPTATPEPKQVIRGGKLITLSSNKS